MPNISDLRSRWLLDPERTASIVADLIAGRDWTANLVRDQDGTYAPIAHLETCTREVIPEEAAPRDLRGFTFTMLDLTDSTCLADCSLDYSTFNNVHLYGASLTGSSLQEVIFEGGSSLAHALLRHCDCRHSSFAGVALSGADLHGSDLRGSDFSRADLRETNLSDVLIDEEPWWALSSPPGSWTRFGGKFQSADHLSNEVDPSVKRRIGADAAFFLFRREHPILGLIWYIAANGGRSAARLGAWTFVVWFLFAVAYHAPIAHTGSHLRPEFVRSGTIESLSLGDGLYFSAVTLTTLGYGDIVPAPSSWTAKGLVVAEAMLGYVLLGMFVAILLQSLY